MKKLLISLFFSVVLFYSCNKSTEPIGPTNPRNLSWTTDTLSYPNNIQTLMSKLWASSPNDVYAIGHASGGGQLYHFDGNSWTPIDLFQYTGVPYDLYGIFGFSRDNVYIVGKWNEPLPPHEENSLIVHFNGATWEKIDIPHRAWLKGIWGSAPNDVWVGGTNGTIIHYDGSTWTIDSLPHPGYPELEFALYVYLIWGDSPDNIRASAYSVFYGSNTLFHTFLYSNGKWAIEDSTWEWDLSTRGGYWTSPEGTWYKGTIRGLYKLQGSSWNSIMSEEMMIFGLHGTSDKNIFISGKYYDTYYIKQFNGSDWYTYDELTRKDDQQVYRDVFTIGGEVFIAGYTSGAWPQKSVMLHGK